MKVGIYMVITMKHGFKKGTVYMDNPLTILGNIKLAKDCLYLADVI